MVSVSAEWCALGATTDTTKYVGQVTQLADPAHTRVYAGHSAAVPRHFELRQKDASPLGTSGSTSTGVSEVLGTPACKWGQLKVYPASAVTRKWPYASERPTSGTTSHAQAGV